jgi:hypothetical protein
MWLVLCMAQDVPALWVYQSLKDKGLKPIELVTTEMFGRGVRWEHRLGQNGVFVEITLNDGRRINTDNVRGAINRIVGVPSEQLPDVQPDDREYSNQELFAFFMSWLYALPQPVLNRPSPPGLCGQLRNISEWVLMASQAGLPTSEFKQSSHNYVAEKSFEGRVSQNHTHVNSVFVIEGHVIGSQVPQHICDGCRSLAKLTSTELLGIEFAEGEAGPWTFIGATIFPDLRLGGQELIDVLESVLRGDQEENS